MINTKLKIKKNLAIIIRFKLRFKDRNLNEKVTINKSMIDEINVIVNVFNQNFLSFYD